MYLFFRSWQNRVFAALTLALAGCGSTIAAESDTESLRAEVRAIKLAYETRIADLESEVKELKGSGFKQKKAVELNIDLALDKNKPEPAAAIQNAVQSSSKMTLGGYTEFTYMDRGDRISSFNQLRTVAQLGAQLHDRVKLYVEVEQENGAVIEGGEATGGELELEQAWLDLAFNPALNFRAGMMLVPIGRYNLYHEGFVNNLVDRPLVDRWIIPTTWFEEGAGFHGQPLDSEALGISYEAYLFNPARAGQVNSLIGFREVSNEGRDPSSDLKAGAARVAIEPARSAKWFADYLELGASGYISGFKGFHGEDELGNTLHLHNGTLRVAALDATYEKWNFGVRGEAAFNHADSGANDTGRRQNGWGYYVEGFYKFWPHFLDASPFGRGFKDPKLVFSARYDWVDLNRDQFNQRDLGRVTVGLGYRPLPNTVVKFDYQIDHSPSSTGPGLEDSGEGKNTDAFLFGVATGF